MNKWDRRFLEMADQVAGWSKDQSTQVGAVVVRDRRVIATGYNGLPTGVKDPPDPYVADFNMYAHGYTAVGQAEEVWNRRMIERPSKYLYAEHAERNAFYDAARRGVALEGADLYITPLLPCADCARGIIQVGIRRVIALTTPISDDRWDDSHQAAREMLFEAKIQVIPFTDHDLR